MTWGQIRLLITKQLPGIDLELVTAAVQAAYDAVLLDRPWKGLDGEGVLVTTAPEATGTVAVTAGSADVVGDGTAFTSGMEGFIFALDSSSLTYSVLSVADAEHLTLERIFEGESATGAGYHIFPDAYTLPASVRTVAQMLLPASNRTVTRTDDLTLRREGLPLTFGAPRYWAPAADTAETGWPGDVVRRVYFHPLPDAGYAIPYSYRKTARSFDGANVADSPLPWVQDQAIVQGALAILLGGPSASQIPGRAESLQTAITLQQATLAAMRRADTLERGPAKLRLPGE